MSDMPSASKITACTGARRGVDEVADPQSEIVGVAVPQRGVDQVDEDPGHLLGRPADVVGDPVVGARFAAEHGVERPGRAPGPVGQRQEYGHGHALLDADQGHDQQRGHGQRELDAVEAEDGPQLARRGTAWWR